MPLWFLILLSIELCLLKIDGLKCACAKVRAHVFIVNDDDGDNTTAGDFLDPGQCLEMNNQQRRFWVAVTYNGKNAFVQSDRILVMECENARISFTPLVMNAIYNCSDWGHRVTLTGWSYLPSDDTYYDEHDMPLSSFKNFRERSQQFVSVYIEESIGIGYGRTICIPELNQKLKRLIIFRVANTYKHTTKTKDFPSILYDDGTIRIQRKLTVVY
ncbi:uncharacterized protein LOC110452446 isoform X2 [Mizuhopecten yessoensis]|nr:uncharacterized protein LOC110452446 isoform X2 [Mizuhopecten yessoensis]